MTHLQFCSILKRDDSLKGSSWKSVLDFALVLDTVLMVCGFTFPPALQAHWPRLYKQADTWLPSPWIWNDCWIALFTEATAGNWDSWDKLVNVRHQWQCRLVTACDCTAALPLGHRSSWFRSISLKPPGADLEGSPANGCLRSPNIHTCMLPIVARLLLAITDNSSLRALAPNFHPLFFMILYVFLLAKDGSRARHKVLTLRWWWASSRGGGAKGMLH
jgi:hypothetical protein